MGAVPVVFESGQHRVGNLAELGILATVSSNLLSFHTTGGIFLDANSIISNGEPENLLIMSKTDNRLYISPSILKKAGFFKDISHDAGNLLALGSDGMPIIKSSALSEAGFVKQLELSSLLKELGFVTSASVSEILSSTGYVTRAELSSAGYVTRSEVLALIGSTTPTVTPTPVTPSSLISTTAGNLLTTGADGKLLVTSTGSPTTPSTIAPNLVSQDKETGSSYGNLLTIGSDGLLLVPNDCGELTD